MNQKNRIKALESIQKKSFQMKETLMPGSPLIPEALETKQEPSQEVLDRVNAFMEEAIDIAAEQALDKAFAMFNK